MPMEPLVIVDLETGLGIREAEGCIEIIGARKDAPRCLLESFQKILSIWKYGLKLDQSEEEEE